MIPDFSQALVDVFIAAGYLNVYQQDAPRINEWNVVPAVLIGPEKRSPQKFIYFGNKTIRSSFDVYFVVKQNLDNTPDSSINDFEYVACGLLMPIGDIVAGQPGAWQQRAEVDFDIDRGLFGKGYSFTCVKTTIDWMIP